MLPLRGPQFRVSRELLNRKCRRAAHRQVRTERMAETMHTRDRERRSSSRATHVIGRMVEHLARRGVPPPCSPSRNTD